MSSTNIINKPNKWSSSSSLSKLLTRISRKLSFSSKKCQQAAKKSNNVVKPTEPLIQVSRSNVFFFFFHTFVFFSFLQAKPFVPQSAPLVRRHLPQQSSNSVQLQRKQIVMQCPPPIIVTRPHFIVEEEAEDDDDDLSCYSLQPNLSRFNISDENLHSETQDFDDILFNEIFHSTKIDEL